MAAKRLCGNPRLPLEGVGSVPDNYWTPEKLPFKAPPTDSHFLSQQICQEASAANSPPTHSSTSAASTPRESTAPTQNVLQVPRLKEDSFSCCFSPAFTRQCTLFQDLIMGQWGREINFRRWRSHGVGLTGTPGPRRWARGQTPWQSLKSPRKG